jgi:hypothetical protein
MTEDVQSITSFARLTASLVIQDIVLKKHAGDDETLRKPRWIFSIADLEQRIADGDNFICPVEELVKFISYIRSEYFTSKVGITHVEKTLLTGGRTQGHYLSEEKYSAAVGKVLGTDNADYAVAVGLYDFFNREARSMGLKSNEIYKLAETYGDSVLNRIFSEPLAADFDVVNYDVKARMDKFKNKRLTIPGCGSKVDFHPSLNI